MDNPENFHLLESIIRLTEQRDQHSLEICLIQTLQELIAAKAMQLYEYSDKDGTRTLTLILDAASVNTANETLSPPGITPLLVEDDGDLLAILSSMQPILSPVTSGGMRLLSPVLGMDHVAGFLLVEADHFNAREQELVTSFLKIYHNYLLLLNDNEHDTLTGLLNRKTFEQRILKVMNACKEAQRASDKNEHFCLAVLDIDHFKRINDNFGHLYGDEVLLLFARIMRATFRDSDLLFRYGGEEFVAILKNADRSQGLAVLERFRNAVAAYSFPQVGKVTVSIGLAGISPDALPTTIIGRADQALYFAKEHGRNQVCSYETLLAEGQLTALAYQGDIELF